MIGAAHRWITLTVLTSLALACGGPVLMIPGGRLTGNVVESAVDFSFASTAKDAFIDLETRPSAPYSVKINYTVKNGRIYLDPREGRTWLDHIRDDPNVRVRLDGKVYPLRAVQVEDPDELEGFSGDRVVLRLDPR